MVFSTLHTNDAPSAVTRLIDIGAKPFSSRPRCAPPWRSGSCAQLPGVQKGLCASVREIHALGSSPARSRMRPLPRRRLRGLPRHGLRGAAGHFRAVPRRDKSGP